MGMSQAERQALIEQYARGPARVRESLAKVPKQALKWRPAEGKWSVHEVVVHCADSETNAALRIRYLLAEKEPLIVGYDQDAWARQWNLAAADEAGPAYPFELVASDGLVEADLRPMLRAAVGDIAGGSAPARVSAAFHETLGDLAGAPVRGAAEGWGRLPVVLSGGCFQNARLAEGIRRRLLGDFEVILHRDVPPGDGGIALGQVLVADALGGA